MKEAFDCPGTPTNIHPNIHKRKYTSLPVQSKDCAMERSDCVWARNPSPKPKAQILLHSLSGQLAKLEGLNKYPYPYTPRNNLTIVPIWKIMYHSTTQNKQKQTLRVTGWDTPRNFSWMHLRCRDFSIFRIGKQEKYEIIARYREK